MRIGESFSKLLVMVILVGILTLAAYVPPSKAVKTWIVDDNGPADFHTIQEAVNAAGDGDTILVKQGTYYEEVTLTGKLDLTLIAENQNAARASSISLQLVLPGFFEEDAQVAGKPIKVLD